MFLLTLILGSHTCLQVEAGPHTHSAITLTLRHIPARTAQRGVLSLQNPGSASKCNPYFMFTSGASVWLYFMVKVKCPTKTRIPGKAFYVV